MTLGELAGLSTPGEDEGRCYICGQETQCGHRMKPSDAFTAWAQCAEGDVMCEHCHPLIRTPDFRRRSWLVTSGNIHFATKDDREWIWPMLLDPPEPPFALYVTKSYKKQGHLTLVNYVSTSRTHFWIGADFADRAIAADLQQLREWAPIIEFLREQKMPKAALTTGEFGPHHYKKAIEGGWVDMVNAARNIAGNPAWEVLVHVAR